MKYILITAVTFLCYVVNAQPVVDVSKDNANPNRAAMDVVSGQLLNPNKFVRVTSGTPYFKETYMKARLIDGQGNSFASNSVRLNLLDNEVDFISPRGQEMVAAAVRYQFPICTSEWIRPCPSPS